MNLSNTQYDSIQREYDAIQTRNRHLSERRRDEVYRTVPGYEEAAGEVASLSVRYVRYREALSALSEKKAKLLTDAGFPADYLEPIYDCPDCRDTGYADGERCHCFRQRMIRLLYAQSNLQEHLAKENFSTLSYRFYEGEDLVNFKKAVETSHSFVENFKTDYRNLIFYGTVGTGKSFLSGCIAKELLEQGCSVIYFSAIGLFNLLAQYSFQSNDKEMLYKTYEDLYNCDLVIVDDLGTEVTNSFTNSQFFSFINERHLRRKATVINTNLGIEDLKNRYTESISSRMLDKNGFEVVGLAGEDLRLIGRRRS